MDLGELPFDMPKLRRRLRVGGVNLTLPTHISCKTSAVSNALIITNNNNVSTDTSGVSQASSSQSVQQDDRPIMGESDVKHSLNLLSVNGDDDVGSFFLSLSLTHPDYSIHLLMISVNGNPHRKKSAAMTGKFSFQFILQHSLTRRGEICT